MSYVDVEHAEVAIVRPSSDGKAVSVERSPIILPEEQIIWLAGIEGGNELLLLSQPRAAADRESRPARLLRIDSRTGATLAEFTLEAAFEHLSFSPDGRHAVLHFGGDGDEIHSSYAFESEGSAGEREGPGNPLTNINLVSVLDLQLGEVRTFTLNGFGGTADSVHFLGEGREAPLTVAVGTRLRNLVAFAAQGELILVDLDDAAANQVAVSFGTGSGISPEQFVLRPGDELLPDATLFVRGRGSVDVAALSLVDRSDVLTATSGFSANISLLSLGGPSADLLAHNADEVPYLLAVHHAQISFIDIRTSYGFQVDLPTQASQLALRERMDDAGQIVDHQLLAWSPTGRQVAMLDLKGIENSLGRRVRSLAVPAGIQELSMVDHQRALVASDSTLYVLDFEAERVTPLSSSLVFQLEDARALGGRLFVPSEQAPWLSYIDLESLAPKSLRLPAEIRGSHYLSALDMFALEHHGSSGYLSLVDASNPTSSRTHSHWGYLLDHELGNFFAEGTEG